MIFAPVLPQSCGWDGVGAIPEPTHCSGPSPQKASQKDLDSPDTRGQQVAPIELGKASHLGPKG